MRLKSRCFLSCRCGPLPRQPFSTRQQSWKCTVNAQRLCGCLCISPTVAFQELNQIARNIVWIVLKYVLSIVPIKAHVKYMRKFHGWSGFGGGRAVQGRIAKVWNTCYTLPLQTLISVFISFLCNLFSFMVELTQVNRYDDLTHVSFTCLVKYSKALPLSKMPHSLASLTNNRWGSSFDSYL